LIQSSTITIAEAITLADIPQQTGTAIGADILPG